MSVILNDATVAVKNSQTIRTANKKFLINQISNYRTKVVHIFMQAIKILRFRPFDNVSTINVLHWAMSLLV